MNNTIAYPIDVVSLLATATAAAREAGALLARGFGTSFSISSKEGRHNLVTEYDKASEKSIIDSISRIFPDHTFLAEESGESGAPPDADTVRWIIDPLDGTVNFAHNVPIFCVSIAAEYRGELLCGVIYHPLLGELFTASQNGGAWLNGQRLHVSGNDRLDDAILVTGFPYDVHENPYHCIDHFVRLLKLGLPIRRLGSAALDIAYVAAGRFDGFWEVRLHPWDIAAGKLLLQEAGGTVTQYDGSPHNLYNGTILATNGRIHEQLSDVLTRE